MPDARRTRRAAVVGGLLALATLVALLLLGRRREAPATIQAGQATGPRAPSGERPHPRSVLGAPDDEQAVPPAFAGPPPEPPIIDEIKFEKTEVCEGEENLVTVKAHTPGNRDDDYLHFTIAGEPGPAVPVRAFLDADGRPPKMFVQAFGRANVATTVEMPAYTIKPCKERRRLLVRHRLPPNTPADFEFRAEIVDVAAEAPMKPVKFVWRFGKGARVRRPRQGARGLGDRDAVGPGREGRRPAVRAAARSLAVRPARRRQRRLRQSVGRPRSRGSARSRDRARPRPRRSRRRRTSR